MKTSRVLEIFEEITRIPRESGFEAPMTAYLQDFAAKHQLACKADAVGNVVISRPASPGKENVPTLVFQAHQDMVCEKKPGCSHDFRKDPIQYVIEDGWMVAKDTTLGADDGIGIATALGILESDMSMGPIECLFTTSEETNMNGAEHLEAGFFTGKHLINIDSEDEGEIYIGCAGGINTVADFKYEEEYATGETLKVTISGCKGGHSGDDINKDRMNAVQQMARLLYPELSRGLQILHITGGNKPNAIAYFCEAVISTPHTFETIDRIQSEAENILKEFHTTDPYVEINVEEYNYYGKAIEKKVGENLIKAMYICPHGVQAMSQDIPGLVETSTNLASVKMESGAVTVTTSQRSSVTSARDMISSKVQAVFEAFGADVQTQYPYPGWTPNINSPLKEFCVKSYRKLFGVEPAVKSIHAGLECGLFLTMFPDLDMISIGPTLRGVHAPGERLELASLDKFVELVNEMVCNFK